MGVFRGACRNDQEIPVYCYWYRLECCSVQAQSETPLFNMQEMKDAATPGRVEFSKTAGKLALRAPLPSTII
jgi:hypothetical protein